MTSIHELVRMNVTDAPMHARRTEYVIKLTQEGGIFVREHGWTNLVEHAKHFHSMTAATAYATMELDLTVDAYTVEPV